MATQWLRLWHDMPHDPKFRVVAKASGQPISLVIALYVNLLVDASQNDMSRGVTKCHDEDLAVTLDCDISQIQQIKDAMQGRLLDGNSIAGWEKRQPKKDDSGNPETGAMSATERKRLQREREKLSQENISQENVTTSHEMSRDVTTDKDKDKDKDIKNDSPKTTAKFNFLKALVDGGVPVEVADDYITTRKAKKCAQTETAFKGFSDEVKKAGVTLATAAAICCKRGWGGFEASWVKPEDLPKATVHAMPSIFAGAR